MSSGMMFGAKGGVRFNGCGYADYHDRFRGLGTHRCPKCGMQEYSVVMITRKTTFKFFRFTLLANTA